MNALSGPTDAELVARVLQADREAFAVVYDRYGAKLYDFAYSMLRQREDAADAVADSFVTFAERLSQLRDPDRLRPWLYAIVRSECLRRLKARKRVSYGDDDQLAAMADDAATPEEAAERAALQKLVWDASAGLADRDRALLDLHLRQGLEGAELGEAMGVSAANAYVMLNRLRAQVDKSLGALLIARLGRDDCDELDALLADWDGTFSPLIRKRVARHVEGCEICGERKRRMVSPWMLLAGVPMFAAPLSLRDRVLTDTQLVASAGPPLSSTSGWSRRSRGAAAAAAFVAAATVTTVVVWPDDDTTGTTAAQTTPTASATAPTSAPPTAPSPTPAPAPATSAPTDEPSASPTTSVAAGTLNVSTTSVDLGTSTRGRTITVENTGGEPVTFRTTQSRGWLDARPDGATVDPGDSRTITVSADRSDLAEGRSVASLRISWPDGSATVRVAVRQENDPVVGRPSAPAGASCSLPVSVAVTDESGLRSVRLAWSGPGGSGTLTMTLSGGRWRATIDPISIGGTYQLRVTATDRRGNAATGPVRSIAVDPCPG